MTHEDEITAAQQIVGSDAANDYVIHPTDHAAQLPADGKALADLLRRSELAVLASEYERKDREANRNRDIFRAAASRANWAVLLTACFSALLLVAGAQKSLTTGVLQPVLITFGIGGVVSGGLASMWLFQVREGRLLSAWMSSRAAAESLRMQYFETVANPQPAAIASAIPLALLQLEYFRRYQFDVQLAFFDKRAQDFGRDADRMLRLGAAAVALASISSGIAVLGVLNATWISVAGLGAIATALSSFASAKEGINQSRRNMESYNRTRDALALLRGRLDDIRAAAADGEREPMKQLVAAVHEQLSAEHHQWLDVIQGIQPAIDRLDATLSKLKNAPAKEAETATVKS